MNAKITDFHKGLDEIEKIDLSIEKMLETENYSQVIETMKQRLTIISQLTQLKAKEGITAAMKLRLDKIFNSADAIQKKVQAKKNKINDRLKERKKVTAQNKKIAY